MPDPTAGRHGRPRAGALGRIRRLDARLARAVAGAREAAAAGAAAVATARLLEQILLGLDEATMAAWDLLEGLAGPAPQDSVPLARLRADARAWCERYEDLIWGPAERVAETGT